MASWGGQDRASARCCTAQQHVSHQQMAWPVQSSAPVVVKRVRRRKHACCVARADSGPSLEQGAVIPPVEGPRPAHGHDTGPPAATSGWWNHVGNALSVAALTSSMLFATSEAAHASLLQNSPPTATYAPTIQPTIAALHPPLQPINQLLSSSTGGGSLGASTTGQPDQDAGWLQPHPLPILQLQLPVTQPWSEVVPGRAGAGAADGLEGPQGLGTQLLVPGVASEAEDKLLEAVRQIEARVDSAMGAVVQSGPRLPFSSILGNTAVSKEEEERINKVAHMLVSEVWEVVDQNYLDARSTGWDRAQWQQLRDDALGRRYTDVSSAYRAIREMMAWGLSDPYCRFITPSELSAMKKYDVTGIGLNLGTSSEYAVKTGRQLPMSRAADNTGVFVVGLSKGSPADKVGMRQGDELVEVDGVPLAAQSPFQAASLIAGQQADGEGPSPSQRPFVELKVRKVDGMTGVVQVERPVRMLSSPVSSSLAKGQSEPVGLVRLSSFNARAQRDLKDAISRLQGQGAKSLVLDLRDNRGGLVSEGLEVARLFLDGDAPIVFTESRSNVGDAPRAVGPPLTRLPLLVLVNEHTASASEIVAGALHDNCRAVLVGSRTYGKGLIQSVYELSDGSGMVLTVGKYLTPNRTDIDRSGIQPDFSSRPSPRLAAETLEACRITKQQPTQQPRM